MSITPRAAIGDDLIALRDAAPLKTASVPVAAKPTTRPLQTPEGRRALGAAAIEIDLIKQNMEREIDRLGEIAAGIEALLNGTTEGGQ